MHDHGRDRAGSTTEAESAGTAIGKRTLTGAIQRRASGGGGSGDPTAAAPRATAPAGPTEAGGEDPFWFATGPGLAGPASALPHLDAIQRSFGRHDVSGIQAHVGGAAATAAQGLNATAYATGDHVAFAGAPDLATAAHEAAHVVQQRGGVSLKGGLDGGKGDPYEQHADEVAALVVRGESAEALLDRHAGGGGGGGGVGPIQRIGNDHDLNEENLIHNIHANAGNPQQQLTALEQSNAQVLWYGRTAQTDEEAEITASASFLQKRKRDWQAELANRQDPNHMTDRPAWEKFQLGMNAATPNEVANQAPWFMDPNHGYHVTGNNVNTLQQIGQLRNNPAQDDPQQLLGLTYQRDTMYISDSPDMANDHKGTFDVNSTDAGMQAWNGGVLRLRSGNHELRLRLTNVAGFGLQVDLDGTVLAGPLGNGGFATGTALGVRKNGFTGALTLVNPANGAVHQAVPNGWTATLETFELFQSWTIPNDSLGAHVVGAQAPRARNRGNGNQLDDNTYNTIGGRYSNGGDRSMRRTLGPQRTRLNFHDDPNGQPEVGWDIAVAPYRRLGGDGIFNEAQHNNPGAYQNQLLPANQVNVNNVDWYYDQANSMPGRFVGGRSNSTLRYMSAAAMLFFNGDLSLADCEDFLAFVIADMVVSGEHSMPECMTTVVQAGSNAPPWSQTRAAIAAPAAVLPVWMRLIDNATKQAMLADAQAALLRLLGNVNHDRKLLKVMVMLDKALYNSLNGA